MSNTESLRSQYGTAELAEELLNAPRVLISFVHISWDVGLWKWGFHSGYTSPPIYGVHLIHFLIYLPLISLFFFLQMPTNAPMLHRYSHQDQCTIVFGPMNLITWARSRTVLPGILKRDKKKQKKGSLFSKTQPLVWCSEANACLYFYIDIHWSIYSSSFKATVEGADMKDVQCTWLAYQGLNQWKNRNSSLFSPFSPSTTRRLGSSVPQLQTIQCENAYIWSYIYQLHQLP